MPRVPGGEPHGGGGPLAHLCDLSVLSGKVLDDVAQTAVHHRRRITEWGGRLISTGPYKKIV